MLRKIKKNVYFTNIYGWNTSAILLRKLIRSKLQKYITKLRLSSHRLETGRYNICNTNRGNRFCLLCRTSVECNFHFFNCFSVKCLFVCAKYIDDGILS